MAQQIIGRQREKLELQELFDSGHPEFVVVHGRRRVGKTYLIREFFADRLAFYHTGLSPAEEVGSGQTLIASQLESFYSSLSRYGFRGSMPRDWIEAFDDLISLLEHKSADGGRQVVFIDEMPWIDTPRSGFVTAFEHFWNGWGAGRSNLLLIVCGSSTSWITDKIINSKGGLFNRITFEMELKPFTLRECEEFYESRNMAIDRYDQLQAYMVLGGIPYYLSMLRKEWSLAQNIDALCFARKGRLRQEFDRLFNSLFINSEASKAVVRQLVRHRNGMLRSQLIEAMNKPSGGGLTTMLRALEEADFIMHYTSYRGAKREVYYRLVDPFCLFHLHFMDRDKTTKEHFWSDNLTTGALNAWRSLAFENVCFAHVQQIKQALGIAGVQAEVAPWFSRQKADGAQIDMLIDRADRVINVCEMKYCADDFAITKAYDKTLRHKLELFAQETSNRKSLHLTLVTTFGLKRNEYAGRIQNVVTIDDLFK